MDDIKCDWCGEDIQSIIMLHVDLWPIVCDGRVKDIMCHDCIKKKLGREPTAHDTREPWWEIDRWSKQL